MDDFNEQRLAYFHEAVRCGSIRAAADHMNIAPSAVSRQIALLEQELATPLMERHRRGVMPTEAGKLLLDYHRSQNTHRADMLSKLQAMRGLRLGSVTVASGEGFVDDLMRGPLSAFSAAYPDIAIMLDVLGTNEILRRVTEDEAEIGLVYNPPPSGSIVSRALGVAPLHVIVDADSPLRRHARLTLRQLEGHPLALLQPAYGIRQLLEHAEFTERIRLRATLATNQIGALKAFVKHGGGITLLPLFAVHADVAAGRLHAIAIDSPVMSRAEAHLITRTGRRLSVVANRFLDYCRTRMRAFQQAPDPS